MSNLKDVKSKNTPITLQDGVERHLRYDLNAMAELEDKYGSVDAAFEKLDQNSIKTLRFFLWAGLVHEDESLTEKQVGSLIDMSHLQEMTNALTQAFEGDMPESNKEEQENPNA